LESKWLEDYLALVKHGSFTKAADARHITQPAFSRRIRALENWLGTDLVDRNAYPAKLTAAGEALIEDIQQLLEHSRGLQRKANDHMKLSGSITVATQHSLSVSICPQWFQAIRPALGKRNNLRVNAANMHDCIEQFLAGNADLLLCYHSPAADPLFTTEGLNSKTLGPDALVPVVSAKHEHQFIQNAQLAQVLPFIGFPNESFFGQLIQSSIDSTQKHYTLDPVYITAQSESVHELVRQGVGVAWLPESLVSNELREQQLLRLPLDQISLDIRLYWRQNDERPELRAITDTATSFTN
jgi:DNA-binding transcriptional LysR family regulator